MATPTNAPLHSASVSNRTRTSASVTNSPSHGLFGGLTMAQVASYTIKMLENITFLTPFVKITNATKH